MYFDVYKITASPIILETAHWWYEFSFGMPVVFPCDSTDPQHRWRIVVRSVLASVQTSFVRKINVWNQDSYNHSDLFSCHLCRRIDDGWGTGRSLNLARGEFFRPALLLGLLAGVFNSGSQVSLYRASRLALTPAELNRVDVLNSAAIIVTCGFCVYFSICDSDVLVRVLRTMEDLIGSVIFWEAYTGLGLALLD